MNIHPTAVVSPDSDIANDVQIGPFCLIEDGVRIASGCRLVSHVVVKQGTQIGRNNLMDVGAVIGGAPQHLGAGAEVGGTVVGDGNQFREYVTIHRAYQPEHNTEIGHDNMFMSASHAGHDCTIGDNNIFANNVLLGGHVTVENQNYFGGGSAVHQFCRIGSLAMVGGLARITRDIPPYVLVDGTTNCLVGLNSIGLRRAGMAPEIRRELKESYRIAFRSDDPIESRLATLRNLFPMGPAAATWQFLAESTRGFLQDRRSKEGRRDPAGTRPDENRRAA